MPVVGVLLLHSGNGNQLLASCGDWLDHAAMSQGSTQPDGDENSTVAEPARVPAGPCQGPHCGEAPSQPFVPPVPVEIGSRASLKAGLTDWRDCDRAPSEQFACSIARAALALPGYPTTIDRPPRG